MTDKAIYAAAIHCVAMQYRDDACMPEDELAAIMDRLTNDWRRASDEDK